jgi:hypothetical protein
VLEPGCACASFGNLGFVCLNIAMYMQAGKLTISGPTTHGFVKCVEVPLGTPLENHPRTPLDHRN